MFNDKGGDPVTLERYSADHHGFLRMVITDKLITGRYYTVPRPQEPYSKGNQLLDYFEFDWRKQQYVPNTLPVPSPDLATSPTASVKGKRVVQTAGRTATGKSKPPARKKRKTKRG